VAFQDGSGTGGIVGGTGSSTSGCAVASDVDAPSLSPDCAVTARQIDPTFTCAGANCAITKALDLTCESLPQGLWLSPTTDGAVVMTRASYLTRLMTVEATDIRVQDVPALANPSLDASEASAYLDNSVLANSASETKWLFVGDSQDITLLRGTDSGWTRTILAAQGGSSILGPVRVKDACTVDENLGYLIYSQPDGLPRTTHLVSWDGSCWVDQSIGKAESDSIVVKADAERRPWVVWADNRNVLTLRSPDGDLHNLLASDGGVALDWELTGNLILRLLPGGLDGTAPIPAVAARCADGIRVFSNTSLGDSGWPSILLPESAPGAAIAGDCPPDGASSAAHTCVNSTSCTQQLSGVSLGFGLARTQSGATFVAWVEYSAQGSYSLTYYKQGGEMPMEYCFKSEISGTGTADLVLAHLTASGPNMSRFHFDLGGAVASLSRTVVMAARGDTLLVGAYLGGDMIRTLTYLEIDSMQLL